MVIMVVPFRHLTSPSFRRLVAQLKSEKKTIAVVESSCGGLIQSSILAVPGASSVYFGGTVAYKTQRTKELLLNDKHLHQKLLNLERNEGEPDEDFYVRSKFHWTATLAQAYCQHMQVDLALAQAGATGPTFPSKSMNTGFSVVAVASKDEVLAQQLFPSPHRHRASNMRQFADQAADLVVHQVLGVLHDQYDTSTSNDTVGLDRAGHLRSDPNQLRRLEKDPRSLHVILRKSTGETLFSSPTRLALLPEPSSTLRKSFLGLIQEDEIPVFGMTVGDDYVPPEGFAFFDTRTQAPLLPQLEHELALYATALYNWKRHQKHCSQCGASTFIILQGGNSRQCQYCRNVTFARQDPSIIVLVTNANRDRALLARSPRHPPKLHTTIAGFVEAGETMEQAVAREVYEETSVRVVPESIDYVSSQPWPFPRSTMIGFLAQAQSDNDQDVIIDPLELASARWFDKDEVRRAADLDDRAMMRTDIAAQALQDHPDLNLLIPPSGVVARTLIDHWLDED